MNARTLFSRLPFILLLAIPALNCQKAGSADRGPLPPHPRILLLAGEEAALKQLTAADQTWAEINIFIINEANKLVNTAQTVERVLIGRRLLDKSREALRRIFYLSYAHRTTGDQKYLARAEKEMLAVAAFSDWNPSHFLDVAEMTMAMAIGYDWLFNSLPESSRSVIRTAIVEKGLKPSLLSSNNGWLKAYHNWNQVCNAGMTYGALAVYEDETELAQSIIDRARESITLPMGDYQPDGAYPEGYGYWGYGTSFNIMYLSAIEKLYGRDTDLEKNEGFMKTASYINNMTGPTGVPFNYSDCGGSGGTQASAFWFASRTGDPSMVWSQKYFLTTKKPSNDRLLPAILIWSAGMTLDEINPPEKLVWTGQGKNAVALMRTSWTDPEAIFVGFKAGSPSVNHGHMDVGSFVMDANGQRWAMDFGMQDYNSLESAGVNLWGMAQNSQRWEVFRYNNFVHNTLTVNDQLQVVGGKSSINSHSSKAGMLNAISDISEVYKPLLNKAVRGIAIVDNKYVMVRDEIQAPASATKVRWTLLTQASVNITGKNTAELTRNGKKLTIRVVSPAELTMKTWSTVPPHPYDAPNPGTYLTGFETELQPGSSAVITVLLIPEGASENTSITTLKLNEWPTDNK